MKKIIKTALSSIFILGFLFIGNEDKILTALTEPDVYINMPDANLRSIINDRLGNGFVPDELTESDMSRVVILELDFFEVVLNYGLTCDDITDLTGLEYTEDLDILNISCTAVTDLSPISNLVNLSSLTLNTKISDLSDIANITGLGELVASESNITDISPLANLTGLSTLYLDNNNITDISVLANMNYMRFLSLANNNISDISPLQNMSYLITLAIDNNNISSIEALGSLTYLENVSLNNNSIYDLTPLSNLTKLNEIFLSDQLIVLDDLEVKSKSYTLNQISPKSIDGSNIDFTSSNVYTLTPLEETELSLTWDTTVTINGRNTTFNGTIEQAVKFVVEKPTIEANDILIDEKTTLTSTDILKLSNAKATDGFGNDISESITISEILLDGKPINSKSITNISSTESYVVKLTVVDSYGQVAEISINVNATLSPTGAIDILFIILSLLTMIIISKKVLLHSN